MLAADQSNAPHPIYIYIYLSLSLSLSLSAVLSTLFCKPLIGPWSLLLSLMHSLLMWKWQECRLRPGGADEDDFVYKHMFILIGRCVANPYYRHACITDSDESNSETLEGFRRSWMILPGSSGTTGFCSCQGLDTSRKERLSRSYAWYSWV